MKKTVLTYGLISGLIVSIWICILCFRGTDHMDNNMGMILGYMAMIVAFAFIFVAVKNYRDHENAGTITFGKAFTIGLYITLIGSTIYVIAWLIAYNFFVPDFLDSYMANTLESMRKSGKSSVEIAQSMKEMNEFKEMYKNPLYNAMFTYMEILPVGLIISLIAAAILKRKPSQLANA